MARYTAKYLRWAKKTAAGVAGTSFPTYDTAMDLGPLASVAETINTVRAENYGDGELQEFVDEFSSLNLVVTVTEMPIATGAAVYGATKNSGGGLSFNVEDAPPEGCVGLVSGKKTLNEEGVYVKTYQGVFYPSVTGTRQGSTFNSKGAGITFENTTCNFTGKAEENGFHTVTSDNLDTFEAAKAWVDKMMAGGSAAYTAATAAT